MTTSNSRRRFLTTISSAAVLTSVAKPTFSAAQKSQDERAQDDQGQSNPTESRPVKHGSETIIGKEGYQFRVNHHLLQMPKNYTWQFTHNITIDSANNIYVIHEGEASKKDHPAIFVFDPEGKFIRAFGSQFQGGGHGIDIRKEGNEEFIYVAAYQQVKSFAKLTLTGEVVWYQRAPIKSGVYNTAMALSTKRNGGRKTFLPTNFAFLDNGGFLLADGYGSYYIHEYDKDANWVRCFGGPGGGKGTFQVAHGLWIDDRAGREQASLLVTDRSHNTLQRLTMAGEYVETISGFDKPCTVDTWKNEIVVSEYGAKVSILDEDNQLLVRFDDGARRTPKIPGLRSKPKSWKDGQFIAPHDACYDAEGNIFVAERIPSGRISKMTRIA